MQSIIHLMMLILLKTEVDKERGKSSFPMDTQMSLENGTKRSEGRNMCKGESWQC